MGRNVIALLLVLVIVPGVWPEVCLAAGERCPASCLAPRGISAEKTEEMTVEGAVSYLAGKLAEEFFKGRVTKSGDAEELARVIVAVQLAGGPLTVVATGLRERPFWVYKKAHAGFDGIKASVKIGGRQLELYLAGSDDAQVLWTNKLRDKVKSRKRSLFIKGKVSVAVAEGGQQETVVFFVLEKTDLGRLSTLMHDLRTPFTALNTMAQILGNELEDKVVGIRDIWSRYDNEVNEGVFAAIGNFYRSLERLIEFYRWGKQFAATISNEAQIGLLNRNCNRALDLIEEFRLAWQGVNRNERFNLVQEIIDYINSNIISDFLTNEVTVDFRPGMTTVPDFYVYGNRRSVGRALDNLINNAVDAFKRNGKIEGNIVITLNFDEVKGVCFSVEDNAGGIEEQLRLKAADGVQGLFSWGRTSKSSAEPGEHGLGLFAVWEMVTGIGGKIKADNNDRGGAVFTLSFPPHCVVPEGIELYDPEYLEELKGVIAAAKDVKDVEEQTNLSPQAQELLRDPSQAVWEETFPPWVFYELMGYLNGLGGRLNDTAQEVLVKIKKMAAYANLASAGIEYSSDMGRFLVGIIDLDYEAVMKIEVSDELFEFAERYARVAYEWYGRVKMVGYRIGLGTVADVGFGDEHELLTTVYRLTSLTIRYQRSQLPGVAIPTEFWEMGLACRLVLDGEIADAISCYERLIKRKPEFCHRVLTELDILERFVPAEKIRRIRVELSARLGNDLSVPVTPFFSVEPLADDFLTRV